MCGNPPISQRQLPPELRRTCYPEPTLLDGRFPYSDPGEEASRKEPSDARYRACCGAWHRVSAVAVLTVRPPMPADAPRAAFPAASSMPDRPLLTLLIEASREADFDRST
jgi:hypothetical protein